MHGWKVWFIGHCTAAHMSLTSSLTNSQTEVSCRTVPYHSTNLVRFHLTLSPPSSRMNIHQPLLWITTTSFTNPSNTSETSTSNMVANCLLLLLALPAVFGFAPTVRFGLALRSGISSERFMFGKLFEEDGPLGKGITVGKVQVALMTSDRSANSIFGTLKRQTENVGSTQYDLASMAHEVCLDLLRRSDSCSWTTPSPRTSTPATP